MMWLLSAQMALLVVELALLVLAWFWRRDIKNAAAYAVRRSNSATADFAAAAHEARVAEAALERVVMLTERAAVEASEMEVGDS